MPNKLSRMTFYCLNSFYVQGWLQSTELFRRAGRSRYGYVRDLFTDVSVKETISQLMNGHGDQLVGALGVEVMCCPLILLLL